LADILGVQKSTVSQYETDATDPSDEIKILISKYFNVSADYLLGIIDTEAPSYNEDYFWKISENISADDRRLVRDFIEFVDYRNKKYYFDRAEK
jgi:transcriptional regulator with XRE-family HTH domain